MHLKRVGWLKRWMLHRDGNARSKRQLTTSNHEVKPSHVNLGGGCIYVPDKDLNEFYALYLRHVLIHNTELNLTEQPQVCEDGNTYSPVIIDIDLRYGAPGLR